MQAYSLKEIVTNYNQKKHVIVRIVTDDGITTYNNFQLFNISELSSVPAYNSHEVIIGSNPYKIFFDIDICLNNNTIIDIVDFIRDFKKCCELTWKELYEGVYIVDSLTDDDYLFYNSNGNDKLSYHIILFPYKYAMPNNKEMLKFFNVFINKVDKKYINFYDHGVYTSIKNLRLLGAVKEMRIKIIDTKFTTINIVNKHKWIDSLITNINNLEILQKSIVKFELNINHNDDGKLPTIEEIASKDLESQSIGELLSCTDDEEVNNFLTNYSQSKYFIGFKFFKIVLLINNSKLILFKRIESSYCCICDTTHDKDNTLFIKIVSLFNNLTNNNERIFFANCRHYKYDKNNHKAHIICKITDGIIIDEKSPKNIDIIKPIVFSVDALTKYVEYDSDTIKDYEMCKTLFIEAPMKMGKTKKLLEFIKTSYTDINLRMCILTFRQTFAYSTHETFKSEGFVLYSDLQGTINEKRIIIQLESLHRLQINNNPIDLLIMDESESLFEQIDSGLYQSFGKSFAAFQYLIKHSKMVICMDAYLSQRTYNIIRHIRGLNNSVYHANKYKREKDTTLNIYEDYNVWLSKLLTLLKDDKKIAFMCNSKSDAMAIRSVVADKFPDKNIGYYSQDEPPQHVKIKHFSDVDYYWSEYDLLITTPTVSAGVSFEKAHFDYVFGYFTDMSCGAETSMQMIGRIRIIKENSLNIYIKYIQRYSYPTKIEVIKNLVIYRHEIITSDYNYGNLNFEYTDNGTIQIYNTDYFTIWLENTRIANLNKTNYLDNFIRLSKKSGFNIILHPKDDNSPNCGVDIDEIKRDHKLIECEKIASANDIDTDKYTEIQNKLTILKTCVDIEIAKLNHVTDNEKHELSKYIFVKKYDIANDEIIKISTNIVDSYNSTDKYFMYVNLNLISAAYDHNSPNYMSMIDILNNLNDNAKLQRFMQDKNIDVFMLRNKHIVSLIICINKLFNIFGWTDIFDFRYSISAKHLYQRYSSHNSDIARCITDYYVFHGERKTLTIKVKSEIKDLNEVIPLINILRNILKKTFGMTLNGNRTVGLEKIYTISEPLYFNYVNGRFKIIFS